MESNHFNITDHVEFDGKGRAICPACSLDGKDKKKNLSLVPGSDGAYKCFRGHTAQEIREALGIPKNRQLPQTLAASPPAQKVESTTVTPQKAKQSSELLLNNRGEAAQAAKLWLLNRGINSDIIRAYGIGLARCKVGEQMRPAIAIPIPNVDKTAYWQKKRVEPWSDEAQKLPEYTDWKQYGIPQQTYFTNLPEQAEQTWLCEGEWDAIVLGWAVRNSDLKDSVAVATFTCGCKAIPPIEQLTRLPGQVAIFYDRDKPGEEGAVKVAEKLGDRAKIALVPMPSNISQPGWDISDALKHGFTLADIQRAAVAGTSPKVRSAEANPLRHRMIWNDDLIDSAPDYTEWLVPDLLTNNELFLLAAGPRTGKSLMAMSLAHAVASGSSFLGRPVIQGTVMYVCLEDGKAKIKEREQAQGWSRGLPVAWFPKFKLSELPQLRELAEEIDPRLIVIDTLSRVKDSTISESSAEMSQVLEPLQELAQDMDCCILLIHHTGKVSVENATQIDLFDTIRGSSAIRAVCRGSMVIAASERDYRLVVENGWGKHDLRIVLDANTLTWKLLGKWVPSVENTSQKGQILDFLKQTQSASIEQIHEATGIPKKSLYEQLSRLQTSDEPAEKVVKEGHRRSYTYRLALFNTIQQLNSVLNSGNQEPDNDRGPIQQKNVCGEGGDQPKPDQEVDQVSPPANIDFVEYPPQTQAGKEDQPIQQLFNTPNLLNSEADLLNSDPKGDQLFRVWKNIGTAVEVKKTVGERTQIRVPGSRRYQWVPNHELIDMEDDQDAVG